MTNSRLNVAVTGIVTNSRLTVAVTGIVTNSKIGIGRFKIVKILTIGHESVWGSGGVASFLQLLSS